MIQHSGNFIRIYFDTAFEPILAKGADGKEYNVIPSDQFK